MAIPRAKLEEQQRSRCRRLMQTLEEQAEDIQRLTSRLSEEVMTTRGEPGKWSLKEIVAHLHRCQQVFEGRIVAMVTEDNPAVTVYDPDVDTEFAGVGSTTKWFWSRQP